MIDLLVFTDLDGTLLDHHSYSWEPASQSLKKLEEAGVPVIINSSKTAAEIEQLRLELDNRHPFITENGSAICIPAGYFDPDFHPGTSVNNSYEIKTFGPDRSELLNLLNHLRANTEFQFRGFADMKPAEVADLTGLSIENAELARQRLASEPIVWQGSDDALQHFRRELEESNLRLLKGGRFFHVMGPVDKAEALLWLAERYRSTWPQRNWTTVALGDSPNDRAMLEAAEIAVVIPAATRHPLKLNRKENLYLPDAPGPRGWQDAMSRILDLESAKGA